MKTITISMDDETYRYCQRNAQAAGISVEDWVTARLGEATPKRVSPDEFERLRKLQDDVLESIRARRQAEGEEPVAGEKLTRDELHDRNAFR
jgi:hypothetical protein